MDTSQIRTNIAVLPLLYNVWPKTVHLVIMSLKVLHTMEGNSFAAMLHGSDFLGIQSETQAEFGEQSTAATYSIVYDFVKGSLIKTFMESKFYHIPSLLNSQTRVQRE